MRLKDAFVWFDRSFDGLVKNLKAYDLILKGMVNIDRWEYFK